MATSTIAISVSKMGRFQNRVNYYVVKAAASVMAESNATVSHAERVVFANKVFINDYSNAQYVLAVLSNSTVLIALDVTSDDNGVTDSDLEFTVNSFYNAFAGVAT